MRFEIYSYNIIGYFKLVSQNASYEVDHLSPQIRALELLCMMELLNYCMVEFCSQIIFYFLLTIGQINKLEASLLLPTGFSKASDFSDFSFVNRSCLNMTMGS